MTAGVCPTTLRSIELFSGSGGLAIGTYLAGFRHVALVESNPDACRTLRANVQAEALPGIRDWPVVEADAREVNFEQFGPVDLVAGGPPCQPFSIAGKHGGMEDPRDMFPEFIRAIRQLRPRAFIAENVRGLLRPVFADYFAYLKAQLALPALERGPWETWKSHSRRLKQASLEVKSADRYVLTTNLLNAADFGIPQVRRRLVIVGIRGDLGVQWMAPSATHSHEALLRDQGPGGRYWERHGLPADRANLPEGQACLPLSSGGPDAKDTCMTLPWRTVRDALAGPPPLPEPILGGPQEICNHRLVPGAHAYPGHTGSLPDLPAKTLKAGVHGVPGGENMFVLADGGVRYFTLREAARLQTFPDAWAFRGPWTQVVRQLGNAVPIELAHLVAASVAAVIAPSDDQSERPARGMRPYNLVKHLSDGAIIRYIPS